ncbi:MAG TPA: MarR family transcriptional regulator [Candidatus Baltobacteraceae bacterium]|jgi:DNA-binding MarR family transcriptional regulator|nr:MarR family transcriptional regulator [Candidatus Baltobacteraceae bacterium]
MRASDRLHRLTGVFFALKRAMHERLRRSHGAVRGHADMPRLAVLGFVRGRGEATMKDIAGFLCVSPPSATALVDGIAAAGLLARRQDPKDRRSVLLRLTPKGERLLAAGMRKAEAAMARMLGRLDAAEQDRLIALLEKLIV